MYLSSTRPLNGEGRVGSFRRKGAPGPVAALVEVLHHHLTSLRIDLVARQTSIREIIQKGGDNLS